MGCRYYEGCKNNGVTFALVILPRRDSHIYSIVKEKAELVYGVITQCVQSRNVERANATFYGNLLQKINTKLGGKKHAGRQPHPAIHQASDDRWLVLFSPSSRISQPVHCHRIFLLRCIWNKVLHWKTSPTISIHFGNRNKGSLPGGLEGFLQTSQRQEARTNHRLSQRSLRGRTAGCREARGRPDEGCLCRAPWQL